jgi:hypothetical protein
MENNELPYSFSVGESKFAAESPKEETLTEAQSKAAEMELGMFAKIEGNDTYYVVKSIDKENGMVTLETNLEGTNASYGTTVSADKVSDYYFPTAQA